jgi:hypothetical protein
MVVFRDSNWDFCVFFFLLFFIFCHKSLFFRMFYDLFHSFCSSCPYFWCHHFLLVCSVSVQSHRTWSTVSPVSQKGHCGSVIPFIRGPWVALVYPVLSLEIFPFSSPSYSCSIFLPFMLLLPFLHRSFLIIVFSVFNHFSRSFGGGGLFFVCCMSSSSTAFASSSACSFPVMPMCPGTHRRVICFYFGPSSPLVLSFSDFWCDCDYQFIALCSFR